MGEPVGIKLTLEDEIDALEPLSSIVLFARVAVVQALRK